MLSGLIELLVTLRATVGLTMGGTVVLVALGRDAIVPIEILGRQTRGRGFVTLEGDVGLMVGAVVLVILGAELVGLGAAAVVLFGAVG